MKNYRLKLALESAFNKNILFLDKDDAANPTIEPLSVDQKLAHYLRYDHRNTCRVITIQLSLY